MAELLTAVLRGGRDDLPEERRTATVSSLDEKVKVAFAGGYEHFVHEGEFQLVDGRRLPVFRWNDRTKTAE